MTVTQGTTDATGAAKVRSGDEEATKLAWSEEMASVGFGTWMIAGLFADGWAHNHGKPDSFFTPWHGILYSGFGAAVAYGLWQQRRHTKRTGERRPVLGQGLVGVGLVMFALGGVADLIWHQLFGIERDIEALLSPTHLILFVGGVLALTGPLRSAWSSLTVSRPSFKALLPALLSMTLAVAVAAFFTMYLSPFHTGGFGRGVDRFARQVTTERWAAKDLAERMRIQALGGILITTALLVGPLLYLWRRWALPFGSATFLFGALAVAMCGIDAFVRWPLALGGVAGGVVTDLALRRIPRSRRGARVLGLMAPAALWSAFFAAIQVWKGVGFSLDLWTGAIVLAALEGCVLSLLVCPPPAPADADLVSA